MFNVEIEIGQLLIYLAILPLFFIFQKLSTSYFKSGVATVPY